MDKDYILNNFNSNKKFISDFLIKNSEKVELLKKYFFKKDSSNFLFIQYNLNYKNNNYILSAVYECVEDDVAGDVDYFLSVC